jgi:hypothetical protein
MRGWLKATVRWSNQECQRRLQTARLVRADRAVGSRLHDGEVGVAQVQELARAHSNPRCGDQLVGEPAKTLLDHAVTLSFEDFRLCVRRWELLADVDGTHRDAETVVERRTATVVELDGVLHLNARGGAVHAASMIEIFGRFCDAEFAADWAWVRERFGADATHAQMPRSDAQRRFDALFAIFGAAAVAPVDGRCLSRWSTSLSIRSRTRRTWRGGVCFRCRAICQTSASWIGVVRRRAGSCWILMM